MKIDPAKEFEILLQIEEALAQNRFMFVMYEKKPVGFLTWHYKDNGIFFNNLFILREFRHKDSLMGIRKLFKDKRLFWKNRKRQREVSYGVTKMDF